MCVLKGCEHALGSGAIGFGWNDSLCAVRWRWPWSKDKSRVVPKEPTLDEICGPEPPEFPEDCDVVAETAWKTCMASVRDVGFCLPFRDKIYAECVATYEARETEYRLRYRAWKICMGQGGGPGRES